MASRILLPETAFALDKSSKKTKRIEDAAHLAFVRRLPSVVSWQSPVEAAHIRTGSAVHRKKHTGLAQKPDDCWTLPLTSGEHKEQHSANELEWWRSHGIDPFETAIRLYEVSGNFDQALSVLRNARSPIRLWPTGSAKGD